MNGKRIMLGTVIALVGALAIAGLLYSCGGGGDNGDGSGSPSGTVALYLTDDIGSYQQVTATINSVQLINTGTGASCDVLGGPVTVDLTNLSGVLQLIDVTPCSPDQYNRIRIEFDKSVALTNAAGTSDCTFTSYLDMHSKPNALTCGPEGCTLDVTGAVNVLAAQNTDLALDFDLKNFTVTGFGTPSCEVTMKVSPLNASDMDRMKHQKAVTGFVSGLDTESETFTLTRGKTAFTVLYSGITSSRQPGLDTLLQRAQDDRLRARVMASDIDLDAKTITAAAVYLKVEGIIEAGTLDTTAHTFSLVYSSGATTKTIDVDYTSAAVEGTLAEGTWVDVKLYGYDGARFLAWKVEVENDGTMTED